MKSSKSSLFLIELIISILFFSLASAACIQLFTKAHLLDKKTQETNQIVIWTQNLAELWYATDGELASIQNRLLDDYHSENGCIQMTSDDCKLSIYLDKNFSLVGSDSNDVTYRIELCNDIDLGNLSLRTACINFFKETDSETTLLYNLSLQQHTIPERGPFNE